MGLYRVYNDNVHPFQQEYNGDMIKIPPKQYVEMEREDAKVFMGMYYPMKLDAMDQQDPRSYKMLRLVPPEGFEAENKPTCHICGSKFDGEKTLAAHIDEAHADAEPFVDPVAEKALQEQKGTKNVRKGVRL